MSPILRSYIKKPISSKHLSEFTKGRIFGLHETQISHHQISHYIDIPLTTVRNSIARGGQEGKEREGRGRYSKTTKWQDNAMVDEALKSRDTTHFEIA